MRRRDPGGLVALSRRWMTRKGKGERVNLSVGMVQILLPIENVGGNGSRSWTRSEVSDEDEAKMSKCQDSPQNEQPPEEQTPRSEQ